MHGDGGRRETAGGQGLRSAPRAGRADTGGGGTGCVAAPIAMRTGRRGCGTPCAAAETGRRGLCRGVARGSIGGAAALPVVGLYHSVVCTTPRCELNVESTILVSSQFPATVRILGGANTLGDPLYSRILTQIKDTHTQAHRVHEVAPRRPPYVDEPLLTGTRYRETKERFPDG